MLCPKCGYSMDVFHDQCPKCYPPLLPPAAAPPFGPFHEINLYSTLLGLCLPSLIVAVPLRIAQINDWQYLNIRQINMDWAQLCVVGCLSVTLLIFVCGLYTFIKAPSRRRRVTTGALMVGCLLALPVMNSLAFFPVV